jgi:hypothetical protein
MKRDIPLWLTGDLGFNVYTTLKVKYAKSTTIHYDG